MGLTIIQLSDSHFEASNRNPLSERAQALSGAIRSELEPHSDCAIVFSGDISNFGRPEDFELAIGFIQNISQEINSHLRKKPPFIIVPGNHDHNFMDMPKDFDERMRNMTIDNCSPSNPPSDAMNAQLFSTQKAFHEFINKLSKTVCVYSPIGLINSASELCGTLKVNYFLLNSTRFTKKEEVPGITWFPIDKLTDAFNAGSLKGSFNIGILHHPYNWYRPDNAKELRRILEGNCDLILTGHEHQPDIYQQRRRATEQNIYVEGGVLQDRDNLDYSSFNVIKIRPDTHSYLCTTFSWNGSVYERITEEHEYKYVRLRQPLLNELDISKEWEAWLEEIGTDFRHPRESILKLSDVFVYPDLQKLDIRKACSPVGIVRDRDVLGFIQEKKRVFIAGAEKIGKTSLAKQLFKDLRESGYVPIVIKSDFAMPKTGKALRDSDRIKKGIDTLVSATFTTESSIRFWQSPVKDRAVIIDDYNKLKLGDGGKDKLIRWLDENFGLIVLISSPGIRITDILQKHEGETLLWTFEHVDITEADSEMRFALIGKWLMTGTDLYQIDSNEIYGKKIQYGSIIDNLIGKGIVPSIPLFILMMMQQLEAGAYVEGSTGMYGTLYELVIRDVIKGAAKNPADLEVKLNYLSDFAYEIFCCGGQTIDDGTFRIWNEIYCEEYNVELQSDKMIADFVSIGVFSRSGSEIGFKYPYYYCFFLARYLAHNIHLDKNFEIVKKLCASLHINDYANTMVFLCHMSKDPRILKLIIGTVKGHFGEILEYDLRNTPSVLPKESIKPMRLVLTSDNPEEEMINDLRKRDEMDRPSGLNEMKTDRKVEEGDENLLKIIHNTNSAHHAIRICGQLLRNFYGNMKGETQLEIIDESFRLCLRVISVLYEHLEKDKDSIAQSLADIIQQRYPSIEYDALDRSVRRSINSMALSIAYGLIKHTARSLGLSDLKPSYDKYIEKHVDEEIEISQKILDIATRLECCIPDFPERRVKEAADDLEEKFIGREVLRVIVWEHFKLFKREFQMRQRVCSALKIEANQAVMITAPEKKM